MSNDEWTFDRVLRAPGGALAAIKAGEKRIAELEMANIDAAKNIASLEKLRPHWAQGFSSDSMAAQVMTTALNGLWDLLGAKHQTEAMQKLGALVSGHAMDSAKGGPWVVMNGEGTQYRTWGQLGPEWTTDPDKAIQYGRRQDAESVHAEDEDAWLIVQLDTTLVGAPAQTSKLGAWLSAALDDPNTCEAMKADIREWFAAGETAAQAGKVVAWRTQYFGHHGTSEPRWDVTQHSDLAETWRKRGRYVEDLGVITPPAPDEAGRVALLNEVLDCRTFNDLGEYAGWNITKLNRLVGNDGSPGPCSPDVEAPADRVIAEIEKRFPNWRSYRDLIDCIDCTLHDLRASEDGAP